MHQSFHRLSLLSQDVTEPVLDEQIVVGRNRQRALKQCDAVTPSADLNCAERSEDEEHNGGGCRYDAVANSPRGGEFGGARN